MIDLPDFNAKLQRKENLTFEEGLQVARALASPEIPDADKEIFLTNLAEKGETGEEVAAFAQAFRELARNPQVEEWAASAIDVCGTGGDKIGTFNISTTVAFVLAAGGVPVLKHGNRSITSKCGSAELLAALGVPLEADVSVLQSSLRELNFTFFFAPAFHPAFKAIMPVRQTMARKGRRSIFNILGPLINPGRPAHQLLGVFAAPWMPIIATALDSMEVRNGFVVNCRLPDGRGMDELSCVGSNQVFGFGASRSRCEEWEPGKFGLNPATLDELAGGDLEENRQILDQVLDGRSPQGLTDTILLNAAVSFFIVGKTARVEEGVELARDLLRGGAVKRHVKKITEFYRS